MANICYFNMRVSGKSEDVDVFLSRLKGEALPCFRRVFDAVEAKRWTFNGICASAIKGSCAWSVWSSLLGRDDSENPSLTDLQKESESLKLNIEVYSKEYALCFAEHYFFSDGEEHVSDEISYNEYHWDRKKETLEEFLYNNHLPPFLDETDFSGDTYIDGGYDEKFAIDNVINALSVSGMNILEGKEIA